MKKIIPFNKVELWTAGTSMLKTVKTSKKKKLCFESLWHRDLIHNNSSLVKLGFNFFINIVGK